MSKRERKTAGELLRELDADPAYRAMRERQDGERAEFERWLRAAERPIIADLRRVGIEVASTWDLVNRPNDYTRAIPILADHLERNYPDRVLEGIGRALAVREARAVWDVLVKVFSKLPDDSGKGAKAGVACALSAAADKSVLRDVIRLLSNPAHGESRVLLLTVLARSKQPEAAAALARFQEEPVLSAEVARLLKRRRRRR